MSSPTRSIHTGNGSKSITREASETDDDSHTSFDSSPAASASSSSSSSSDASSTTVGSEPADGTAAEETDEVEFTGTVVQAGSPVVLDDGTETYSVETDASLRLGEEVTVRGRVRDGRIDADEVL